jgi:hypothetical protein
MPIDPNLFDDIEAQIKTLDIDEIKKRLQPLLVGYYLNSPVFDPGAFIYRARKFGPHFQKGSGATRADLIYPPAAKAQLGRLNRAGTPTFYGAMNKEAVFFELSGLRSGDELLMSP